MVEYLYRLSSDVWHDEIIQNLNELGVEYSTAVRPDGSGWIWYRVSVEEAKKLPLDGVPYLPLNDGSGFGLYPDQLAERDVEREGRVWVTHNGKEGDAV